MNLLIIGCGYVGKAVAAHARSAGYVVTVTTRSAHKAEELQQFADHVVVLENNNLAKALQNQHAVLLCVAPDNHSSYETTYLQTAKALIEGVGPSTRQILYTGSTSVYGDHNGAVVDEQTMAKPENENTGILLETENFLLKAATPHLNICILRLGEIIGPGRMIVDRLRRLNSTPLPGNGQGATNLSPLEDIVRGIDFALNKKLNGLFNLCNDVHISRKELYDQICLKEGLPKVQWDPSRKSMHAGNKIVSNAKIKNAGFRFNEG